MTKQGKIDFLRGRQERVKVTPMKLKAAGLTAFREKAKSFAAGDG